MATDAPPVGQAGFKLHANQDTRLRASNIVFVLLPTAFVILRLVSRRIARAGYWVLNPSYPCQDGGITTSGGIVGRFSNSPCTTIFLCSPSNQSLVSVTRSVFTILSSNMLFSNSQWVRPPHIHTPTQQCRGFPEKSMGV